MMDGVRHYSLARDRDELRHLLVGTLMVLMTTILDAAKPWGLSLSLFYLVPALYVGWTVPGRISWVIQSAVAASIFLVPLVFDPTVYANKNTVFTRTVGFITGLLLVLITRDRRRLIAALERANTELQDTTVAQKARIEATIRDLQNAVRAKQQAERSIYNSDTFSGAVLSLASEGIGVWSLLPERPYLRFSVWNDRMEEITGYGMDEINELGWHKALYVDPNVQARAVQLMPELIAGKNFLLEEREICRRDGTKRTIAISTMRIEDGNGEPSVLGLVQDISDRRQADETIAKIIEVVSPETGQDFFQNLVNHLSRVCEADYAFIAELDSNDPNLAMTVALSHQGRIMENVPYDVRNTPCENVVKNGVVHYPTGVQQLFPLDPLIPRMGVDSYLGVPLFSTAGKVCGLLVLAHSGPLANSARAEVILRVLATRVSAELQRGQAERLHRASQQRLRSFFDAAAVLMSVVELNGHDYTYVESNALLAKFFGRTPEQLAGKSARELGVPQVDISRWVELFHQCVNSRAPLTTEYPFTHNGERRWYHGTISHIGPGKQGPQFSMTTVDVTDRKLAEESLRDREHRLRALFDQTVVGIAECDTSGKIVRVNDHFCERLGFSRPEILQLQMQDITHPDDVLKTVSDGQALVDGGQNYQIEKRYVRKDGSSIWVKNWVNGIRDETGVVRTLATISIDITDQKQAEDALKESEQRLQLALAASRTGVWEWDIAADRVYWSPECYEIIGVSSYGGSYDEFIELVHPDDREGVAARVQAALDGETDYGGEFRVVGAENQIRWLTNSSRLERDAAGNLRRMVGTVRDITESKLAAEALRISESRYRAILDALPDMLFVNDLDGRYLDVQVNDACNVLQPPSYYSNRRIRDVLPENMALGFRDIQAEVLKTGSLNVVEALTPAPKGHRWLEARIVPFGDDRTLSIVRDITDRKNAESVLKASEARLRTLLENLDNVAVQAYEPSGTITFWNRGSERLYGYRAEEAIGQNLLSLLHSEDSAREEKRIMEEATSTGWLPPAEEVDVQHRDGTRMTVLASRVLHRQPGKNPEFFCFDVDVTDRKKAAEKLGARQAELLHSSRLAVVGEMVAALSHEVAQPLNAIGNFAATCADLVDSEGTDEKTALKEYISAIVTQTTRCGAILHRLRNFSRRAVMQRSVSDVNDILRQSLELLANELSWHNIEIDCELSKSPLPISCDPVQIQQVIVNLLTNARDALHGLPDERRRITFRSSINGEFVQFEVEDRGCGLTPEIEKRLFEPFFSTKESGMGIGLSISQSIIEEHRGQIDATPLAEGGTVFRVRLPIYSGEL